MHYYSKKKQNNATESDIKNSQKSQAHFHTDVGMGSDMCSLRLFNYYIMLNTEGVFSLKKLIYNYGALRKALHLHIFAFAFDCGQHKTRTHAFHHCHVGCSFTWEIRLLPQPTLNIE